MSVPVLVTNLFREKTSLQSFKNKTHCTDKVIYERPKKITNNEKPGHEYLYCLHISFGIKKLKQK